MIGSTPANSEKKPEMKTTAKTYMYCELPCPSIFLKNQRLTFGKKYNTEKPKSPNDPTKRIQNIVLISPPTTLVITPSKIKTALSVIIVPPNET